MLRAHERQLRKVSGGTVAIGRLTSIRRAVRNGSDRRQNCVVLLFPRDCCCAKVAERRILYNVQLQHMDGKCILFITVQSTS